MATTHSCDTAFKAEKTKCMRKWSCRNRIAYMKSAMQLVLFTATQSKIKSLLYAINSHPILVRSRRSSAHSSVCDASTYSFNLNSTSSVLKFRIYIIKTSMSRRFGVIIIFCRFVIEMCTNIYRYRQYLSRKYWIYCHFLFCYSATNMPT